jgi:pimeloyl-ACP methyl ester carboxylesterase
VVSHLQERGHHAVTLDLPAHGEDRTPLEHVTLPDYVNAIVRIVRAQKEPPVLVGHGIGGACIAGAAEVEPGIVAALVFVAGLVPVNGSPSLHAVEQFDPEYLAQVEWSPDRRSVRISPKATADFLCSGCSREVVDEIVERMAFEPIAPYETPVVTTARFSLTRKYYVETLRDRIIPLSMQRAIQMQVNCRRVFSLDTGHSPFFSAPEDLTACLVSVAAGMDA